MESTGGELNYFQKRFVNYNSRDSLVVMIPTALVPRRMCVLCDPVLGPRRLVGDPGSNPGRGILKNLFMLSFKQFLRSFKITCSRLGPSL